MKQLTGSIRNRPLRGARESQAFYLITAHTSPVRFLRHAVLVKYSWGFRRYVSIMKFRYAKYLNGKDGILRVDTRPFRNSGSQSHKCAQPSQPNTTKS